MASPLTQAPARPEYLCGILTGIFLSLGDLFNLPAGATVGQILLVLFLPLWLNAYLARREAPFDARALGISVFILICAVILLFLSILSAFYAPSPLRVGRVSVAMIAGISLFFLVVGTITRDRALGMVFALVFPLAIVGGLSVAGLFNSSLNELFFWPVGTDRSSGLFKNPNQYGIATSTVAPAAVALIFVAQKRARLAAGIVFILLLCGLVLSGSKTNLVIVGLSLSIAYLLLTVAWAPRERRPKVLLLAVLVSFCGLALLTLALYFMNARHFELLTQFFLDGLENRTVTSRQIMWKTSLELFRENPFTGVGAGAEVVFFESLGGDQYEHSHNSLIDYARTLGAPGLIFLAGIYTAAIWACGGTMLRALKRPRRSMDQIMGVTLALGSLNYLLANMMSDSFGPSTVPFFWLIFFLQFVFVGKIQPRKADRNSV